MKPARDQLRRDRRRAPQDRPRLRGRLWVETAAGVALTDAGADLLEQIDVAGSLSEAARRLRFSYRRAWMLADAMNRRWPAPLVVLSTGGPRGGGARLTELGRHALGAYRDLQLRFEHFLDTSAPRFAKSTRA
jgi:molybdate transport system regulatory protein